MSLLSKKVTAPNTSVEELINYAETSSGQKIIHKKLGSEYELSWAFAKGDLIKLSKRGQEFVLTYRVGESPALTKLISYSMDQISDSSHDATLEPPLPWSVQQIQLIDKLSHQDLGKYSWLIWLYIFLVILIGVAFVGAVMFFLLK